SLCTSIASLLLLCLYFHCDHPVLHSFPTRRSSDLQSRDRNSFPLTLLRLAGFRGARTLAKTGALRQRRLAVSSTGRASPPLPPGDRKSTRLNSSHVSISYAVFCLKKKKIQVI